MQPVTVDAALAAAVVADAALAAAVADVAVADDVKEDEA